MLRKLKFELWFALTFVKKTVMNDTLKIPHYRRLYDLIKKQIREGVYKEGDLLPSENELCTIHGVTRPTIRHALEALLNESYIKKHQGKGSIVSQIPNSIGLLSVRGATSAIGKSILKTKIITKPIITKWPESFIFNLSENEINSECIYMERLRLINDMPLFYEKTYLPNLYLPRFTSKNHENKSLFETLNKYYHIEIKGGEQRFKAIRADEILRNLLDVEAGAPILNLDRKHNTNKKEFSFYSSLFCNTEVYSLHGAF